VFLHDFVIPEFDFICWQNFSTKNCQLFSLFLKCFSSINVLPILLSFLIKNVPKVRSNPIQVRCKRSGIGRTRSRRFAIVNVFCVRSKKFFLIGVNSLQKYSEVAFKRVLTSLNKVFVIIFIVVVVVVVFDVVVLKMKTFSFILNEKAWFILVT